MKKYLVTFHENQTNRESYTKGPIEVIAIDEDDANEKIISESQSGVYDSEYGDSDWVDTDEYDTPDVELIRDEVRIIFPDIALDESKVDPKANLKSKMVYEAEFAPYTFRNKKKTTTTQNTWAAIDHRGRKVHGIEGEEDGEEDLANILANLLNTEPGVIDVGDYYIEDVDLVDPEEEVDKEKELAGTLFNIKGES